MRRIILVGLVAITQIVLSVNAVACGDGPSRQVSDYIWIANPSDISMEQIVRAYFPNQTSLYTPYEAPSVNKIVDTIAKSSADNHLPFRFLATNALDHISLVKGLDGGTIFYVGIENYRNCSQAPASVYTDFITHLLSSKYDVATKKDLLVFRLTPLINCSFGDDMKQYEGNPYYEYALGAEKFYDKDYDGALKKFSALKHAPDVWVAETAQYMTARLFLFKARLNWNGYDDPVKSVDQSLLKQAKAEFDDYLASYPNGSYADTARNVQRLIARLGGDSNTLASLFVKHLDDAVYRSEHTGGDKDNAVDLYGDLEEWHTYMPKGHERDAIDNPFVLTYMVFDGATAPVVTEKDIVNNKNFDAFPGLRQLVLGNYYLNVHNYAKVAEISIPDGAPTAISDSIKYFKAAAFGNSNRPNKAIALWTELLHENPKTSFELTPILMDEYKAAGRLAEVGKKNGPLDGVTLSEESVNYFYQRVCDDDVLLSIANDKDSIPMVRSEARSSLMNRQLVLGNFKAAYAYFNKLSDPGDYSKIQTALRMLHENPDNPKGLLNIGYYLNVELHDYDRDSFLYGQDICPAVKNGKVLVPYDYYQKVLTLEKNGEGSVDEAKALHFLVLCAKPGDSEASCLWDAQRPDSGHSKKYFDRLHAKYPNSRWTKETPYYYEPEF